MQVRGRGNLTLPAKWRRKYSLDEGDPVTLIDLEGVLVVSPKLSLVDKFGNQIEEMRKREGLSVEELVQGVAQQRAARHGKD